MVNVLQPFKSVNIGSCMLLIFFSMSATILTEASKLPDGTYPYNTYAVPCSVEAVKLLVSVLLLNYARLVQGLSRKPLGFEFRTTAAYAFPAFCYFVSNNCMFHIVKHLGASTFQIMNNLKVLSTGIFMYVFLNKKLSWLQWKALVILATGCMVTQLNRNPISSASTEDVKLSYLTGYVLVFINVIAAGAGGVFSEKLLKGITKKTPVGTTETSIHWQNIQLYIFGFAFGLISLYMDDDENISLSNIFRGFNGFAYATVASLATCGLLVSFILKYLDNVIKCFCTASSMLCVALIDSAMKNEVVPMRILLAIVLTGIALEQYHAS
jgi:solute carrier family 35 (UDP-sugar transporter), member A1/2/3